MFSKHKRIEDKKAIEQCKARGFCELCGQDGNDPHHIISRGASGPDHPFNLINLCRGCHRKVHDGYYSRQTIFQLVSFRERTIVDEGVIYKIMRGEK